MRAIVHLLWSDGGPSMNQDEEKFYLKKQTTTRSSRRHASHGCPRKAGSGCREPSPPKTAVSALMGFHPSRPVLGAAAPGFPLPRAALYWLRLGFCQRAFGADEPSFAAKAASLKAVGCAIDISF